MRQHNSHKQQFSRHSYSQLHSQQAKQSSLPTIIGAPMTIAILLAFGIMLHSASSAYAAETRSSQSGDTKLGSFSINGQVLDSTDAGSHWSSLSLPSNVQGNTLISTTAANDHWIAWSKFGKTSSEITLARSADRGQTWQEHVISTFNVPAAYPVSLFFFDTAHGWVVANTSTGRGSRGVIFTTSDQGNTWNSFQLPFAGSVSFSSPLHGWLVGGQFATMQNRLMVTHDGGQTWLEQSAFPLAKSDMQARPTSAIFAMTGWVEVGHTFVVTHDNGSSWAVVTHDPSVDNAQSFDFTDTMNGWAIVSQNTCKAFKNLCTTTTQVFHTKDGGNHWSTATFSASS